MKETIQRLIQIPESQELEIYQDTLREFGIVLVVVGIIAGLRIFFVDGLQITASLVTSGLLLGSTYLSRRIVSLNYPLALTIRLAWYLIVTSIILAIAVESWGFPESAARFYYPVAVLISSQLVARGGIVAFSIMAVVAHIVVSSILGHAWPNSAQIGAPLGLILFTAVASFLASRQLRAALETAEDFSARTSEMLEQIRNQRAELTKTVKALADANTRLERLNVELDEARKTAEQADRFKSEFLAHMSHELRTPLNAILNFSAFVADGLMGEVNQEQVDTLQKVIDSGNHLLSLINDVLDISKIEAGMMTLFIEEVDLNAALNAAISIGKGLTKDKPIQLITEIQENLPTIHGDRRRIRQIFLNLVSNAVKFTPKGHVTIRAAVQQGVDSSGETIHISVQDTGIGISAEDQPSVFEPFMQARHELRNVIGTGLGLPICKHFVEAHGGQIWVESEIGAGSTFHVLLPVQGLHTDGQSEAALAATSRDNHL